MNSSRTPSMSIQDRIRAMNETLDKVEAAPSLELTATGSEERTISTFESSTDKMQQSALHSEDVNAALSPSKRSSVVDMWRQREGPKTPSRASVTSERPQVSSSVRQVVVAPPFVQKRRSLVTSPVLTSPQEIKKDQTQEKSGQEESTNQLAAAAVRSSWQPRQSPVPQSPVSVPKPLWASPPKLKDQSPASGGRKRFVLPHNEATVSPRDNVAQPLKSHLATQKKDFPKSPISLVSQKKQEGNAKVFPSFKDHAPVDLTIVPSANDFEADTRSTPGSRRSRVSDLVAVVSKHEQAEGTPIPDIHHTKSASPSTESTGTRRSSVVDFWKSRTTQPTAAAVPDRPPVSANAPRKAAAITGASLKDVFEKRKEKETKETHSDASEEHGDHSYSVTDTTPQEKTDEESVGGATSIANRWAPNTGNRFLEKNQDRFSVGRASDLPLNSMTTLSNSLKDVFEKRKENESHSDDIVEHENHHSDVANNLHQERTISESETIRTSVASRWIPNGGISTVGRYQTRPTVDQVMGEAPPAKAADSQDEAPNKADTVSPHAISFKEKARLFEEKSSQNRPGLAAPKKTSHNENPFKASERLGANSRPSPSIKSTPNRWNQNVDNRSVQITRNGNISSGAGAPGNGRLPQIPPMHPKKGSPKSTFSSRKNALRDSTMSPEEGAFSTKWEDDISGPGMLSTLDPSAGNIRAPQVVANDSESEPENSGAGNFAEKVPHGTTTHARTASTGSFGELLPDSVENLIPSLKRHARIPSAGSMGELGARYRNSSVGSIGDVTAPAHNSNDSTLKQNQGTTKSNDGSSKKNALSSRMVQSLLHETKTPESPGLKPNESTVLPKPLRFQKTSQEGTGGREDQTRYGDALVSSKESAFDSWPSKSYERNEQEAQSGTARKRNRRNLASLGKRHIAKTIAQKPTHGDAYSVVSNPSSGIFSSQRSTQSQFKGTESALKPSTANMSDWPDKAWPSEGLDVMFSLSVDSGSPGQNEIPDEIVTKKLQVQGQREKKETPEGRSPSKKPSPTKSNSSGKFSMTDALDPIDEYQWSQPAVNNVSQVIPQPSEYTALHVSVSEPKWQSTSDLSFGVKPSLHSPGFEDNKSDFSVFSDSAVSKSSSTSSLANRAERALQARRRKNRTYVTTGKESNMAAQVTQNAVDQSKQQHSSQSAFNPHLLNPENSLGQEEVGCRYDEAFAQSLSEKRRAAGLMTTYKTSSRFMEEEDDELALQSASPPARKLVEDEASLESGESSYRTLETATSESESPWSKGHTKRRSVGPVPEKFIDESAENMDNFQKAFESLGLSQIASDLAREVRLATLDISNLAKGMNETVKTFRAPACTKSKAMVPKEDAPFDEDVAIEVEYLEDFGDDDESASNPDILNGSVDDFAFGGQQRFGQPSSKGRGTKSAYV